MPKLILDCHPATVQGDCILTSIMQAGPVARLVVDIARAADAEREFADYCKSIEATGKPASVSMRIARADRSPPGFKKLKGAAGFHSVNC
ncbi:hypothetical protein [Bradyrhizobium embrapense]|uniref:hypothetical protein n=1 Tax=Bradyrhizobium embrapense TaxID=630921 RepID=UPI00067BA40F|nr:hypothetical protein [Bradyrhizobium embrapense]